MKDYTSFRENCKKDCHILFHHPFDRPSTAFWDVTHGCIRCPTCNKGIVSFDNWQEYYSHGCDNIGKQWLIPTWFWRWMYKIPDVHLWGSVVSASLLYTILGWSIYSSRFGPQHAHHPQLVGYEL
ncbi:Protein of unknown function [Pyronema omphalodes CBS 100304]|uniref:Uncharacterized protein n=1 Tax=Pyronema omphalodes (strain CBS 100304) TaxID=1076935 RepID=U4KYE7_PYROM|nr:Protein of unknown function [Pyronema omphalodes CBS 100304]